MSRAIVFGVLLCVLSVIPAQAQEKPWVQFSPQPFYWTYDHVAVSSDPTDISQRGASVAKALYGPVLVFNVGPNELEGLLLSLGLGATSGEGPDPMALTGQVGLVLLCAPQRTMCGEVTGERVPATDDYRALLTAVFRWSQIMPSPTGGTP